MDKTLKHRDFETIRLRNFKSADFNYGNSFFSSSSLDVPK